MAKHRIKIRDDFVIELDDDKLKFNEATLMNFIETSAGWYDYYSSQLAELEKIQKLLDLEEENLYYKKFIEFKEGGGCTDKLAEAKAFVFEELIELKKLNIEMQKHVFTLKQHLKAWDKAHDNAKSRCFTLNKEMEKLSSPFSE